MPRRPAYPAARRGDVVEMLHGVAVADPYRWLEDFTSDESRLFVTAQNELSESWLEATGQLPAWRRALEERWHFERVVEVPRRRGHRLFYTRHDGHRPQPALFMLEDGEAEPRLVLDPNGFSGDGTVAMSAFCPDPTGTMVAYGVSSGGSDWGSIRIRRVGADVDEPEVLGDVRFPRLAWHPDGSGFWYVRHPAAGTVPEEQRVDGSRVMWHALGTAETADTVLYERPDDPSLTFVPMVTDDGRWLLLSGFRSCEPVNLLLVRPLAGDGPFTVLVGEETAHWAVAGSRNGLLYCHTTLQAPRGRLVSLDPSRPERPPVEILPEEEGVLEEAALTGDVLVVHVVRDAHSVIRVVDVTGRLRGEAPLPAPGTVYDLQVVDGDDTVRFGYTSFLHPPTVYAWRPSTSEFRVFHAAVTTFDASRYVTRQVFFPARDGTRIPMFLTHARDLIPSGDTPTQLYGYGGFAVSMTPGFSVPVTAWLDAGGIYAVANIRGGGEYGRAWHDAGRLRNKTTSFDDFVDAAEWLVAQGYTRPGRLAIRGGSNGGLLTAACMLRRPDLFGAVVSSVPVIDMLRFHRFTCGRYWVSDYGDPERNAEDFATAMGYSPLHTVSPGTAYPPVLVMTADTDDRVVPSHGAKFVATLQHVDGGGGPALLRVETRAGHGHGKPVHKRIEEAAAWLGFVGHCLGMDGPGDRSGA